MILIAILTRSLPLIEAHTVMVSLVVTYSPFATIKMNPDILRIGDLRHTTTCLRANNLLEGLQVLFCFLLIASTHWASTKRDLLMLALSTIRSFTFSVLLLASEPARSTALIVLDLVSVAMLLVTLTHSIASDLDDSACSSVAVTLRLL